MCLLGQAGEREEERQDERRDVDKGGEREEGEATMESEWLEVVAVAVRRSDGVRASRRSQLSRRCCGPSAGQRVRRNCPRAVHLLASTFTDR